MTYFWFCFRHSAKMEPRRLRPKLSIASDILKHREREPGSKTAATTALPCARAPSSAAPHSWRDPPRTRGQVLSSPGAASPLPSPCLMPFVTRMTPPLLRRTITHDRLGKLDPVFEEAMVPWSARWRRIPLPDLRWGMEHRLETEVVEGHKIEPPATHYPFWVSDLHRNHWR
jgi:hypothetical protein